MSSQFEKLACFVPTSINIQPSGNGVLSKYKFVAKDLVAVDGHTSSFGNVRWRETHTPSFETAPLLRKLLNAGAALVGLTKMDQLAYSLVGNVSEGEAPLNPLYPDRFTGGSSSGSASAVSGGLADFGIGTDTAGSIRVPAAACGIFGIRPTHSAIDSSGVIPLAQSVDVVGLFARTANILKEVFDVLVDNPKRSLKINEILIPNDVLSLLHPELAEITRLAARAVAASIGASVKDVEFGSFIDASVADTLARIQGREIWANHSRWVESNLDCLDEDVRARLERCHKLSLSPKEEKSADEEFRKKYTANIINLLGENKVIAIPVMPNLTPLLSSTAEEQKAFRIETFKWVAPASLCGIPQVVIPSRLGSNGRILGFSLLGAHDSDDALLAVAMSATNGDFCLTV